MNVWGDDKHLFDGMNLRHEWQHDMYACVAKK